MKYDVFNEQGSSTEIVILHRYRRIVSNNCTDGLQEKYAAKSEQCPGKAPRGLHILTSSGKLVAEQGYNTTFIILLEEVRSLSPPLNNNNTVLFLLLFSTPLLYFETVMMEMLGINLN